MQEYKYPEIQMPDAQTVTALAAYTGDEARAANAQLVESPGTVALQDALSTQYPNTNISVREAHLPEVPSQRRERAARSSGALALGALLTATSDFVPHSIRPYVTGAGIALAGYGVKNLRKGR
jgi:hypothetical protein